jgi:geranylgeranyl diphosphate synthase type II
MRYSLFSGGKRIRPVVACAVCEALGGRRAAALAAGAAVEMIHTYSLVHDDLPAMDDDDLRRGKPTSHKVFGEATAILVGDALQACAFELLGRGRGGGARMVAELARAAGAGGMVGGQVMDLDGTRIRRPRDLEAVYLKKTAALFEACARMGAIAAGAPPPTVRRAGRFGRDLGLAFQATDDILDASQDRRLTAKDRQAASFPNRFGWALARRQAARYARRARGAVVGSGPGARRLRAIVDFIETRNR